MRRMSGGQQQRLSLALALIGRPTWCSSTSRPRAWTRARARRRGTLDPRAARRAAPPSCSPPTRWTKPSSSATASASSHHGRLVAYGSPAELTTNAASPSMRVLRRERARRREARGTRSSCRRARCARSAPASTSSRAAATPGLVAALTRWLAHEHVLLSELRAGQALARRRVPALTGERERVKARGDHRPDRASRSCSRCGAARACSSRS